MTESEVKEMFSGFTESCMRLWDDVKKENMGKIEDWFNGDTVGKKLFEKIDRLEQGKEWGEVRKILEFYYKRLRKTVIDNDW